MEKQNQVLETTAPEKSAGHASSHHRWQFLRHWWWSTLPATIAILLIIVWAVGNNYFAHFKLGSRLIAAHSSNSALEQAIATTVQSYHLAIVYPNDTTQTFPLSDIGVTVQEAATVTALRQQQDNLANRLRWWRALPIKLVTKTDAATLQSFIATHASLVTQPAKDASLSIQNGTVQLANAVAGKEYGLTDASKTITTQADQLQTTPIKLRLVALHPTLTSTELVAPEAKLKQALGQHIAFTIGSQAVSPSPSVIASWLELSPDPTSKTINIGVNSGAVTAYINKIAGADIQPPRDQVNTTSADDSTSVLVAGANGQTVSGEQAAATTISQNLLAGKGLQLSLPVTSVPYGTITAGNWPKWIEVNLTTKRMYAYEYGQLVDSFLVSAGKPSTPTPTGEFHIWEKLVSQTMTGPGYVQPNVPWINYFDHSGDAIHGNYWRAASVFGNVNTSHGCVGVQVPQAEWIYNWAPIGTPIIIHN